MILTGIAKKIFTSLFLGTSLGAGPYGIAMSSSAINGRDLTPVDSKDPGFGELCLLDEAVCEAIADKEWKEDEEALKQEEISKNKEYESDYWKARKDDYCGWGFQWETLNTFLACDAEDATQLKKSQSK
ncbi:hypothetical protein MSUIS_03610 [Mycoplasma suis KI3806]|uniref:Uncharacterized protein n=1 Tax=Mycoplasma suis (strain KI_3806) TaxID=708248 RepID=F0V3N2_MYCS3|nr:hypothetical protein [Mycoplasma suis]CBZ40454.1 hypothetical protein MSUIS_03610 [Mycoplasma suis KI3806]